MTEDRATRRRAERDKKRQDRRLEKRLERARPCGYPRTLWNKKVAPALLKTAKARANAA